MLILSPSKMFKVTVTIAMIFKTTLWIKEKKIMMTSLEICVMGEKGVLWKKKSLLFRWTMHMTFRIIMGIREVFNFESELLGRSIPITKIGLLIN